ncbi:MAG: DegT/DnrJ/EryC1/StrS family aminotransferase [Bdellovibrionota bacterium]
MDRFSDLENKYVLDVLNNSFNNSLNNVYNSKLEKAFAQKFKSNFAIGITNGTATLHTALKALDIGTGDEVIVPPLTMASPSLAVLQNGSIPVFADVDPETFCITAEAIEKVITKKTKVVMTVSLYGLAPDYDKIMLVCKKHNLFLIEDNAQCFLGQYKNKLVGEFGHFSSYSFQSSKHMTSGEGGMLTVNDEVLADKARKFSCLGYAGVSSKQAKVSRLSIQDPNYSRINSLGFNYRMSELNSAVALGQLERLDDLVNNRIHSAKIFDSVVKRTSKFTAQTEPEGYINSYWAYSVLLNTHQPETDWYKFRDQFQKNGGDGYYAAWKLTYMEPYFQKEVSKMTGIWQKFGPGLCPIAENLQPRLKQFKTNYWNLEEAHMQAEILEKTIKGF